MNKESLRTQFAGIKDDATRLKAEGKLSPEALTLMCSLIALFEIMVSVFLEKTTRKNSTNSSIPPSQTEKDNSSVKSGSNPTGRSGKGQANNFREVETEEIRAVTDCEVCGADLTRVSVVTTETRTKIDILFEKQIHRVLAEVKHCSQCDTSNKGKFPPDMAGPLQYGSGLKSYILNLLIAQMVPLKRCQQMIKAMIGQTIAESTLLSYMLKLGEALARWEQLAIAELLASPVIHVDETSMRVSRKKQWVHVHTAGSITVKLLHPKRGKEAIEHNGVIPRYGGIIVHDCWASYLTYNNCGHGLCGAHLVRELAFIVESNEHRWAAQLKKLLLDTCKAVSDSENKVLSESDYARFQKRYRTILTHGAKEMPAPLEKQPGQAGRVAQSDAQNLLGRLKKHETAVLLFAREKYVPFTNNQAERELRMGKVKQKVSGCFRSETCAAAYCRISSYLQTMSALGYNPLAAIQMAFTGELYEVWGE